MRQGTKTTVINNETVIEEATEILRQQQVTKTLVQRWVCEVCGMIHTGAVPSKCDSCGVGHALVRQTDFKREILSH